VKTCARSAKIIAAVFVFALAGSAQADNCHCETYRGLSGIASMGKFVGDLGLKTFSGSIDEAEALKTKISASKLIPEECKAYFEVELRKPKYQLEVKGDLLGPSKSAPASVPSDADQLIRSYEQAYASMAIQHCFGSVAPPAIGMLPEGPASKEALSVYTEYQKKIDQCVTKDLKSGEAYKRFSSFLSKPSDQVLIVHAVRDGNLGVFAGFLKPEQVKMLQAYHAIINAGSESEALALVKSQKDGLDADQFAAVVTMVGSRMARNYDHERRDKKWNAKGAVSGDSLLKAARDSTLQSRVPGFGVEEELAPLTEGVCRDIASMQAKLLEARGFQHSLVVTRALANSQYHVTVAAMAPKGSDANGKVYLIDYSSLSDQKNKDGAQALFAGGKDISLNYRLFKPGGAMVADVPTEMGKFMAEAAGFKVTMLDPLARNTQSMVSASAKTDGGIQYKAFTGQDGVGAKYLGVAAAYQYGGGGNFPGRVGLIGAYQIRPGEIYYGVLPSFPFPDGKSAIVYGQVEQHMKTPEIKLGGKTTAVLDQSMTGIGAFSYEVGGKDKGSPNGQGDIRFNSEIQVKQGKDTDKLQAKYWAGIQLVPGLADVRNVYWLQAPTVLTNYVYGGAQGSLKEKDVRLIGDVQVVASHLSVRSKVTVGAAGPTIGGSAYISGRVTEGSSLYEDGSIRRVGATIIVVPVTNTQVQLTGEVPLEGDDKLSRTRLFGTLNVSY